MDELKLSSACTSWSPSRYDECADKISKESFAIIMCKETMLGVQPFYKNNT